jgi:predicted DNA-binding transcriptional regulator AlpA
VITTAGKFTEDDLRNLPPVVDVPTAAAVLGIGRSAAYDLIRTEKWPTPTVRLGKLIRIPTSALLDLIKVRR